MAHPFSAVPLGFSVMGRERLWWGGCAWDSFALPTSCTDEPDVSSRRAARRCDHPCAWVVGRDAAARRRGRPLPRADDRHVGRRRRVLRQPARCSARRRASIAGWSRRPPARRRAGPRDPAAPGGALVDGRRTAPARGASPRTATALLSPRSACPARYGVCREGADRRRRMSRAGARARRCVADGHAVRGTTRYRGAPRRDRGGRRRGVDRRPRPHRDAPLRARRRDDPVWLLGHGARDAERGTALHGSRLSCCSSGRSTRRCGGSCTRRRGPSTADVLAGGERGGARMCDAQRDPARARCAPTRPTARPPGSRPRSAASGSCWRSSAPRPPFGERAEASTRSPRIRAVAPQMRWSPTM